MNDFENYVFDVLRVLKKYENHNGSFSINTILKRYFTYTIPFDLADSIHTALKERDLIFAVEEENGATINENGKLCIAKNFTEEYKINRALDYLFKHYSWELLTEIMDTMQIELTDREKKVIEAKIIQSGLVDYQKFGYYTSLKIKEEGTIALDAFESYSEYRKDQLVKRQAQESERKPLSKPTMISFSELDIQNLDKIINGLRNPGDDTVPELLDGYSKFPDPDSEKDMQYRVYEDFLIGNNLCSPKHVQRSKGLNGFLPIELASEGRRLIFEHKSIRDFIKENEGKLAPNATFIFNAPVQGQIGTHSSSLEAKEMNQSVRHTPSVNDKAKSIKAWYNKPLFKYFIWPLAVLIVFALISWFIATQWHIKQP